MGRHLLTRYVLSLRIDQLLDRHWFLAKYETWWTVGSPSQVYDIEFAVLVLRLCSYALQFLPSPSYTIDNIVGMDLARIRASCDGAADTLALICTQLDETGSLFRLLHLAFAGLRLACQGRMQMSWATLRDGVGIALRIGLCKKPDDKIADPDQDTRKRVLCNLHIWDRHVFPYI